jgi:hypothetical protein
MEMEMEVKVERQWTWKGNGNGSGNGKAMEMEMEMAESIGGIIRPPARPGYRPALVLPDGPAASLAFRGDFANS